MALTDHCDVFGALHEDGINRLVEHVMRKRPSLFNYGTRFFVLRPERLCHDIRPDPEVVRRGNPLLTEEDPLPIFGTDGTYGIDFCVQLAKLAIDFHPGSSIGLPPELAPPLGAQRLALTAEACAGIVCPDRAFAERIGDDLAGRPPRDRGKDDRGQDTPRPPPRPLPGEKVECFCLELFALAHIERIVAAGQAFLVIRLDGLEIVDIKPEGLENALECYIAAALRLAILPKLRLALDTLVFELGGFLTLSVGLTPISAAVPNNPAIEDDQLKVFVELGVGP